MQRVVGSCAVERDFERSSAVAHPAAAHAGAEFVKVLLLLLLLLLLATVEHATRRRDERLNGAHGLTVRARARRRPAAAPPQTREHLLGAVVPFAQLLQLRLVGLRGVRGKRGERNGALRVSIGELEVLGHDGEARLQLGAQRAVRTRAEQYLEEDLLGQQRRRVPLLLLLPEQQLEHAPHEVAPLLVQLPRSLLEQAGVDGAPPRVAGTVGDA
eukprot:scaffold126970_cov63-Phaeocystis_antarctica.AAC.6